MRRAVRTTATGIVTVVGLLSAGVCVTHAQTSVTTCGQTVSGDAVLANDLDCPPDSYTAVMHTGGRLDLAGHTISGSQYAVICGEPEDPEPFIELRKCRVSGGTITGFTKSGVSGHKLDLDDVTFSGSDDTYAIYAAKSLRFANVHIVGAPGSIGVLGFHVQKVKGTNLTVEGGQGGIVEAGNVDIDGIVVSGLTDQGVVGKTVKIENGSFTGGTLGIGAVNAKVAATTVTGADTGILSTRMQIKDSTVTGNDLDLDSVQAPKVKNTTCNTSNGWGVCAND